MWVRNDEYGAGHMRGWLYVQGWWGWVLPGWLGRDWEYFTTWHVEDRNKAYNPNKMPGQYHWVAYEWEWAPYIEAWRHKMIEKHKISDGGDGGEYDIYVIEDWMLHDPEPEVPQMSITDMQLDEYVYQ
jgi:hypothetical protein